MTSRSSRVMTAPSGASLEHCLAFDEYRARPGLRASTLKIAALRTLAHYRAALDAPSDSRTLLVGRALHARVLEPGEYGARYVRAGKPRSRKADADAEDPDAGAARETLSWIEYDAIEGMAASIAAHPAASALLAAPGDVEVSVFWERSGSACKARVDRLLEGGTIIDVKTCEDASPGGFMRAVRTYGYAVQAAWYLDGLGARDFVFLCVEKPPPHAVAIYDLDAASLSEGRQLIELALERIGEAERTGIWTGYEPGCVTLSADARMRAWGEAMDATDTTDTTGAAQQQGAEWVRARIARRAELVAELADIDRELAQLREALGVAAPERRPRRRPDPDHPAQGA